MGTSVFDSELLRDAWSTEEMRGVFNDAARMQRWLDVEAALAQAQARCCILRAHRDTPMMGRTLSLQALPITFGFKVAVWLSETDRHLQRLAEMAPRVLVGSIVGAVGSKASFGAETEGSLAS